MKLEIQEVSAKLLESAIWMYAYDFDEVAVHLVATAAFDQYINRLGYDDVKKEMERNIKPENRKDFWKLFKKTNNFIKHGAHQKNKLDEIDYDPEETEIIILLACEANLFSKSKNKLACAQSYRIYYAIKYPHIFKGEMLRNLNEVKQKAMKTGKDPTSKETLKLLLTNLESPLILSELQKNSYS